MNQRYRHIESYLSSTHNPESDVIAAHFAAYDRPLQPTSVLIPVAAHQEADRIVHSLSEYVTQTNSSTHRLGRFSLLLSLNHPTDADPQAIDASVQAVETAQSKWPEQDIRYSLTAYETPRIGKVRKDLWDAALQLVDPVEHHHQTDDFIGINHDIDTDWISPRYISTIQAHYQNEANQLKQFGSLSLPLSSRYTQVTHSYPIKTHPRIARALFWKDFTIRQIYPQGGYENGLVVPFSDYANKGGVNETAQTHEMITSLSPKLYQGIARTPMNTSPRRYIDRLHDAGYDNIWNADSFSATDNCRTDQITQRPDITEEQLSAIVNETLQADLEYTIFPTIESKFRALAYQQKRVKRPFQQIKQLLTKEANEQSVFAKNVLTRTIGTAAVNDAFPDALEATLDSLSQKVAAS